MKYNKTLVKYLKCKIGILLLAIVLSCDSGEVDCNVKSTFNFTNETNFKLETGKGVIEPNGLLSITQDGLGPCNITESDYISPLFDSPTIILNDTLCKTYNSTSVSVGVGPLGISNFTFEKIDNNNYEFNYTFKESEFENVENCN